MTHPDAQRAFEEMMPEPTWSGWACQYPGKMPRLYGAKEFAEVNLDADNGDRLLFLSSAQLEIGEEIGRLRAKVDELAYLLAKKIVRQRFAQLEVAAESVSRNFTNELGNAIRITIEGPTSTSENILTPMEVAQLRGALNERASTGNVWQAVWDAATERAAKECPNCKGTRSPSSLDPEWKGRCECVDPSAIGAVVAAYALPTPAGAIDEVRIERARQMSGPDLWAVRYRGDVLNKDGEWEWEPMPSGRDEAFLARARFDTAEEAIAAAIRGTK